MSTPRITVLISGRGSNLAAIVEAMRADALGGSVTHVISNRPDAAGLAIARDAGAHTAIVDHRGYATREEFDAALAAQIDTARPDLIVLAGFMRVLGAAFVQRFQGRLLNIHPSLLPLYPGLHTHRRALADGVRIHGCTVHFVTSTVDVGPIVAQAAVPVAEGDDEASLAVRVLAAEHRLLPAAIRWFCAGRLRLDGRRVYLRDRAPMDDAVLLVPAG